MNEFLEKFLKKLQKVLSNFPNKSIEEFLKKIHFSKKFLKKMLQLYLKKLLAEFLERAFRKES